MVDVWAVVQIDRKRRKGRLIERDGELLFFQPRDQVDRFEAESIDERRREAQLTDGSVIKWTPTCASCSQPRSLRRTKTELLTEYDASTTDV